MPGRCERLHFTRRGSRDGARVTGLTGRSGITSRNALGKAPMSTPTTARGALLRRAGTLLVAAALVGAPATSALADPTPDAGPTATVSASPTPSDTPSGETGPTS